MTPTPSPHQRPEPKVGSSAAPARPAAPIPSPPPLPSFFLLHTLPCTTRPEDASPRVFLPDRRAAAADSPSPSSPTTTMDSKHRRSGRKPASSDATSSRTSTTPPGPPPTPPPPPLPPTSTRSLDAWTSFRVDGVDRGEFDSYCGDLGLSGPEEFAIPAAAWEASKARSSPDLLPVSPSKAEVRDDRFPVPPRVSIAVEVTPKPAGGGCGGIKGNRPTVLAPPPSMSLPVLGRDCSTWELVRSFTPDSATLLLCGRRRRRSKKLWMKTRPRRMVGYLVGWRRPR